MLFRFRSVVGSALGSGCCSWSFRPSERSISGLVVVARFESFPRAAAFARRWAAVLPVLCGGVLVRFRSGAWAVSVPVLR